MRAALTLDQSVFPVQGPPGAGKTHAGAHMICALVRDKQTAGVTANSHKVIRLLLDKSLEAAGEQNLAIQCIQKVKDEPASPPGLEQTTKNPDFIDGLSNRCQVGGATSWFWARPDAAGIVDVLFVDEAAQMSLANVLAVSQAAESIVLLGDPRQLEQPIQGSHPDGVAISALDHVLGEHATIESSRGLFLEETWRLHPDICTFTSELFYEGRLRPRAGLAWQEIRSSSRVRGTGLRYLDVQHEGNQNSSPQEAVGEAFPRRSQPAALHQGAGRGPPVSDAGRLVLSACSGHRGLAVFIASPTREDMIDFSGPSQLCPLRRALYGV
jgi:AAA domain